MLAFQWERARTHLAKEQETKPQTSRGRGEGATAPVRARHRPRRLTARRLYKTKTRGGSRAGGRRPELVGLGHLAEHGERLRLALLVRLLPVCHGGLFGALCSVDALAPPRLGRLLGTEAGPSAASAGQAGGALRLPRALAGGPHTAASATPARVLCLKVVRACDAQEVALVEFRHRIRPAATQQLCARTSVGHLRVSAENQRCWRRRRGSDRVRTTATSTASVRARGRRRSRHTGPWAWAPALP